MSSLKKIIFHASDDVLYYWYVVNANAQHVVRGKWRDKRGGGRLEINNSNSNSIRLDIKISLFLCRASSSSEKGGGEKSGKRKEKRGALLSLSGFFLTRVEL